MCNAFRDLKLSEYCATPAHLAALPNETKRELRGLLVTALRKELTALVAGKQEASEGTLFLLFLVTPVPETQLATPNEMMEWVGLAALYERDGLEYVLGCLRNREQSEQSRAVRQSNYAQEQEEKSSVLARLEKLTELRNLPPREQQYALDAIKARSRAELATLWGLSLEGVKTRLRRLRKKIEDLKKD